MNKDDGFSPEMLLNTCIVKLHNTESLDDFILHLLLRFYDADATIHTDYLQRFNDIHNEYTRSLNV